MRSGHRIIQRNLPIRSNKLQWQQKEGPGEASSPWERIPAAPRKKIYHNGDYWGISQKSIEWEDAAHARKFPLMNPVEHQQEFCRLFCIHIPRVFRSQAAKKSPFVVVVWAGWRIQRSTEYDSGFGMLLIEIVRHLILRSFRKLYA